MIAAPHYDTALAETLLAANADLGGPSAGAAARTRAATALALAVTNADTARVPPGARPYTTASNGITMPPEQHYSMSPDGARTSPANFVTLVLEASGLPSRALVRRTGAEVNQLLLARAEPAYGNPKDERHRSALHLAAVRCEGTGVDPREEQAEAMHG